MAVGLAIAQQMMQQQGGPLGPVTTVAGQGAPSATSVAGSAGLPELLTPQEVAGVLGVGEADVIAILESGELKGKKIGATYRVKRSALDEYLSD
jgi:excisionase family DNA binding protein